MVRYQKSTHYRFLSHLTNQREKVFRPKSDHHFVLSKTKELSDDKFGKLGERALIKRLKYFIHPNEWFNKEGVNSPEPRVYCNWLNQEEESFKPYDFTVEVDGVMFFIDAKTTRGKEDTVFYLSINELKFLLDNPKHYLIARITFLEEGEAMMGIPLHEEFCVNFYFFKKDTLALIKNQLEEWKEHYQEKRIRFTTNHLTSKTPKKFTPPQKTDSLVIPLPSDAQFFTTETLEHYYSWKIVPNEINELIESKEEKLFDFPEFYQWAEKTELLIEAHFQEFKEKVLVNR